MNETQTLIRVLRQTLAARGLRYRDVAKELKVSEATIKRAFSQANFDLDRLAAVCKLLDLSFFDLAKIARESNPIEESRLSAMQEEALAADSELFYLFCLLLKGTTIASIRRRKLWDEKQLDRKIQTLARLKLIDWTSKTQILMRIQPNTLCNSNGPLYRVYGKALKEDFLDSPFAAENEHFSFSTVSLSPSAQREFLLRLRNLTRDFQKLETKNASPSESPQHVCLMMGLRPWVFGPIREKLRRSHP